MITRYINDDITKTSCQAIAHGVNCQGVMGSGVAKALYEAFPVVKEYYLKYYQVMKPKISRTSELLGYVDPVFINDRVIFNCFTQDKYGNDSTRYVDYPAVVDCFRELVDNYEQDIFDGPLAIPKIGCGLAGGNWEFMEQLINDVVGNKLEIWVYYKE